MRQVSMLLSINICLPVSVQDWQGLGGLYFVMEYSGGTWTDNGFGDRWMACQLRIVIFCTLETIKCNLGSILLEHFISCICIYPGLGRSMQEVFKALPYVE